MNAKELRKEIDGLIFKIEDGLKEEDCNRDQARAKSLVRTKLQEAKMWAGKILESENKPFPEEFQDHCDERKMKQENVKLLKEKISSLGELTAKLAVERTEFEKENAGLIMEIHQMEEAIGVTKIDVKHDAMIEFNLTGEKKLFGGIGIRVSKTLDYTEEEAMIWAKENMPVAIKTVLDKKQFEGYAKKNELNFVVVDETTSVTFPKEIKLE